MYHHIRKQLALFFFSSSITLIGEQRSFVSMPMNSSRSGFTLVETALVLLLIGIFSASVLKGYEFIQTQKQVTTIKEVEAYRAAFGIYYQSYGFLPGDNPAAQTLLPNCTAALQCFNGNRNMTIGTAQADWASSAYNDVPITTENTQVWVHLAASDLLPGVTPSDGAIEWRRSHPAARYDGGFRVIEWNKLVAVPPADPSTRNRAFAVTAKSLNGPILQPRNLNPLTPRLAGAIDQKMDDGDGTKGSVLVASAVGSAGCWTAGVAGQPGYYNTANTDYDCVLAFGIDTAIPPQAYLTSPAVNGVCGSAAGIETASSPSANLCSVGSASGVTDGTSWTWSCSGSNGGINASCSAPKPAARRGLCSHVAGECLQGNAYGFSTGTFGPYTTCHWACQGTPEANCFFADCSSPPEPMEIPGQCGSAHNANTGSPPPSSGRCADGTASGVSGSGPWTWTCAGYNGGATASCNSN